MNKGQVKPVFAHPENTPRHGCCEIERLECSYEIELTSATCRLERKRLIGVLPGARLGGGYHTEYPGVNFDEIRDKLCSYYPVTCVHTSTAWASRLVSWSQFYCRTETLRADVPRMLGIHTTRPEPTTWGVYKLLLDE
jgi:hypothetical protein